ncbi:MAG: insulinase family protein [Acutalibacteraceae bacterium]
MTDENDDFYSRRIMTDVFGGGPYSRLFMNVREKLSLCYYCSARLIRGKGIIVIQSGIEKENRQKVLDEINRQLDIMKNGEFSDEDFEASKKAICDAYRSFNDTPDALDIYYGTQLTGDIVTPDEAIENFLAVTRDDVKKTACALSLDTVYMLAGTDKEDGADE